MASIGTQIDRLYKLKQQITEAKDKAGKTSEAKRLLQLTDKYKKYENELMESFPTEDLNGGFGKLAKASVTKSVVGQVKDWDQLYKFISRTKGFDLLNRAFNNAAYRERLEAGKDVPGVRKATIKKLSLRKL